MATPTYSQTDLYEMIDGMVHQKFPQVNDRQVIVNRAVRFVLNDIDLRSNKRSAALSPNLFDSVYDYTAPSDLKARKIIDIKKQVSRSWKERWQLVDEADFDRRKGVDDRLICIKDANFSQILRIDGVVDSGSETIHDCDSLTADGTWAVVSGTDATNLTLDQVNFVEGSALNFDTNSGGTTAAIENSTMTQHDLTSYDELGQIFVWVYIPATSGLTNFILRWGNDTSNYWSRTVTTDNAGNAFAVGWNLLRFNWSGATETGTVDPAKVDYLRLTITKTAGMAAATDWRVDEFSVMKGEIYDVVYYTKYGWQNSSGTYIEESSASTDLVIADTEEIEGIALKGAEIASYELKEREDATFYRNEYFNWRERYIYNYPSEALVIERFWY